MVIDMNEAGFYGISTIVGHLKPNPFLDILSDDRTDEKLKLTVNKHR